MAQIRSATSLSVPRVQVIAPARLGETAILALRARGIEARAVEAPGDELVAWALSAAPTPAAAIELAAACERGAAAGRPVCLFAPPPPAVPWQPEPVPSDATLRSRGRAAIERAAALAYLRAHGAVLTHDVDVWLEAVVALARYGLPRGPRAAVIAPPGSWLEAQALALAAEAEAAGARPLPVGRAASGDDPTDVLLYDPALGPAPLQLPGLHIPVVGRGELSGELAALHGARGAVGAIEALGRAAERIAVGAGPASTAASAELGIDEERLAHRLAKLAPGMRVGDHETKGLLRAYGVPITRQAVGTTPSDAVKKARSVGYPVELKPWGPDLPTEPEGCPVERGVSSDAQVRRAFAAVLAAAGRLPTKSEPGAVIVREPPPLGRDLAVSLVELPALGWTVVLDAPGVPHIAAAPAPLRLVDANALAAAIGASRAGDPELDRVGLANLLRRVSHLVVDLGPRLRRLELPRVVVGGRGARTVVADAWCELA